MISLGPKKESVSYDDEIEDLSKENTSLLGGSSYE
jgi:hypothetical protein